MVNNIVMIDSNEMCPPEHVTTLQTTAKRMGSHRNPLVLVTICANILILPTALFLDR